MKIKELIQKLQQYDLNCEVKTVVYYEQSGDSLEELNGDIQEYVVLVKDNGKRKIYPIVHFNKRDKRAFKTEEEWRKLLESGERYIILT